VSVAKSTVDATFNVLDRPSAGRTHADHRLQTCRRRGQRLPEAGPTGEGVRDASDFPLLPLLVDLTSGVRSTRSKRKGPAPAQNAFKPDSRGETQLAAPKIPGGFSLFPRRSAGSPGCLVTRGVTAAAMAKRRGLFGTKTIVVAENPHHHPRCDGRRNGRDRGPPRRVSECGHQSRLT